MTQIGRNDACRCGSGRKYKRCCLPREEAEAAVFMAAERARLQHEEALHEEGRRIERRFDAALDLRDAQQLDAAEAAARSLLADYPEEIDGAIALAMVLEAREDLPQAIDWYRHVLNVVLAYPEEFDADEADYWRTSIGRLEARLPLPPG